MVLLLGTTASGKTAAALTLAPLLNAEIVSIDSMQVYRRMDIGTAKPTPAERAAVRHHLIDVVEPSESFSVARFVELADAAIADITARGKTVLAVAGTPLYLMGLMYGMFEGPSADEAFRVALRERAAREGTPALHAELAAIDSAAAARIHPNDLKRIERALEVHRLTGRPLSAMQTQWDAAHLRYPAVVVGIRREKEDTSRRINQRVRQMFDAGLVDEVRALLGEQRDDATPSPSQEVSLATTPSPFKGEGRGEGQAHDTTGIASSSPNPLSQGGRGPMAALSDQARQAVGYAEILAHLRGECSLDDAIEQIKINTRRLAKHQRTWFRKFPMTRWVDVTADESEESVARRLLDAIQSPGQP
ncbi:MAG: tRNA (adenosine(37)-N6)-dimethylallyltransferase MiaA [Planctomycetia bacterium]|nr:MAG: tRNA (adenosine(37)-N6)-dimethylallyltransferase MiaA [Planctomycetia bacterium]RIK70553.1 MAG: tRNA (adenosine(37)-N6)-dimethylallyltransferase MiaA [Planctomycetota bacterium]